MRVAGFVLVGGRSVRMGCDKARLVLESHLLVEDVAAKVSCIAGNVALVGEPERYRDLKFECLPDLRPGLGPLAGIETALASGRGDLNLIVACDMPGIETAWLERLLMRAKSGEHRCVVSLDASGEIQPLCAVYPNTWLPDVRNALDDGRLRLLDLVEKLAAERLSIENTISNVNSPQEWAAWQREKSGSRFSESQSA